MSITVMCTLIAYELYIVPLTRKVNIIFYAKYNRINVLIICNIINYNLQLIN